MFENNSLDVRVTSSSNVFPSIRQGSTTTVPLSIIDSTVSGFAPCAGIWYYDPPSSPEPFLSTSHMRNALSKTLTSYPQLCGRIRFAKTQSKTGHTNRYRRVHVTYNAETDIGVPFIVAESPKNLADFIPSTASRKASSKVWDASQLPSHELFPATSLALSSDSTPADAPGLIIQITTFACGSTAIALEFAHCLADAHSMSVFIKDWASISQTIQAGEALPILSPTFDPQLLDSAAGGDIDAKNPDPALQEQARNLPFHRFDWYRQVPGQPWPLQIPPDFDHSQRLSPTSPIPWADWKVEAPCLQRIIHFSADEIQSIYAHAISQDPESKISKHDALLAHLWTRINEARLVPRGTQTYLNMTFGIRPRLSPPLPDNFLGSPILIAAIQSPPLSAVPGENSLLSESAKQIRKTLQVFTPSAIAAHLHDAAFEYCPQRIWQGFLGDKHLLLTTWLYLRVHDVDFVGNGGPSLRFVESVMPSCDGLVQIMEAPGHRDGTGHWSRNGVDVNLFLEKDVMERLLEDGLLWG
ncbi:bahd hydroxycinnamoyl transferase HCT1 [Hyphodiscus hymeniophilus]|uniref:Bahd hydroxycinnamoyl transferase HCT1 n=1 Tax=Hyphodiscus hymeniophilus TaxID=353542 RepID=A0A9P6VRM0_9HELO|nr:bahd hydroxycinnamoyl transferase HCT1 [Hyphodiscus hymeniophilus]